MIVESEPSAFRGGRLRLPLTLVVLLVLCSVTGQAEDVSCPSQSLNTYLRSLDKTVSNTVSISGTCTETVYVEGFANLTLDGAGSAIIERPAAEQFALDVSGSGNLLISGLTFQSPGSSSQAPLVRISRSTVVVQNSSFKSSNSNGLDIADLSNVNIVGSTIQDNKGTGISVSGHSQLQVSAWWPSEDLTQVLRNGTGISVSHGCSGTIGNVKIQDNKGAGVMTVDADNVVLGTWGGVAPTITGNGALDGAPAVQVERNSEVWITNLTKIQDNPGAGVSVGYGGKLVVCGAEGLIISNNGGFGIDAWMGAQVFFWCGGPLMEQNRRGGLSLDGASKAHLGNVDAVIRRNGDPGDAQSFGGIRVEMNSVLEGVAGTVSDNNGPGIYVRGGSAVSFTPTAVITGNRGYGVHLELNSTAEFTDNTNVSGNRRFDLFCTAGSFAGATKGTHPAIGKMNCPDWTQLTARPTWFPW